jgi:hypothetical protein
MSGGRRGGERRRACAQSACTRRKHERSSLALGRRVLRSVLRPVRVNPHYTRGAKSVLVVGRLLRHHGWASPRKREEPTLGSDGRTLRGSPNVTASARKRAWHVEKRKEVEASVPARTRELGFGCPHVVMQLQKSVGDVWSRIRSANALQKKRSGSSEQGPSSSLSRSGETGSGCIEQKDESHVGLTARDG